MAERLIVTNGDNAVSRLREAGIEADFIPWRDALHEGPVPAGLLLQARSLVRAQFMAKAFGLRLGEMLRQFEERNAAVSNHGQYERVELWFEHDLYDQLQFLEVLDFFALEGRTEGLLLVQGRDYLGTLSADDLRSLAATARPVDAGQSDAARRAWAAFTASKPEKLAALAAADMAALPYLASALRRLLQELPAVASGLSLTEERVLELLAASPRSAAELFAATQEMEEARFLGDLSFFRRLDGLAFVRQPLIAGLPFPAARGAGGSDGADYRSFAGATLRLTDSGRQALAGRFDHARENALDRWLGGTHVTPRNMWRRDRNGLAQVK